MLHRALIFAAMFALCATSPPPASSTPPPLQAAAHCGTKCGTERWAVKTLTDSDAASVQLSAEATTITALRAIHAPPRDSLPAFHRVGDVERHVWGVNAVVVCWKLEADHDFHIVIADPAALKNTMIAEVPDAKCTLMCASPVQLKVAAVRKAVIAALGKPSSGSCKRLRTPKPVVIEGVGFLDFIHGQTGVAPNGVELHPVLAASF